MNLVKVRCWYSWSLHMLITSWRRLRRSLDLSVLIRRRGVVSNLSVRLAVLLNAARGHNLNITRIPVLRDLGILWIRCKWSC